MPSMPSSASGLDFDCSPATRQPQPLVSLERQVVIIAGSCRVSTRRANKATRSYGAARCGAVRRCHCLPHQLRFRLLQPNRQ